MEVIPLPIDGAFAFVPQQYEDERGWFKELYAVTRYRSAGVDPAFVQDNLSMSQRLVLRGLHGDPRMAKLVQVLRGSAYDVMVDVRRASPTFGRWFATTLKADEPTQLYVPAGCLHGL